MSKETSVSRSRLNRVVKKKKQGRGYMLGLQLL